VEELHKIIAQNSVAELTPEQVNTFLSFLLATGYLTVANDHADFVNSEAMKYVQVPNMEIQLCFVDYLKLEILRRCGFNACLVKHAALRINDYLVEQTTLPLFNYLDVKELAFGAKAQAFEESLRLNFKNIVDSMDAFAKSRDNSPASEKKKATEHNEMLLQSLLFFTALVAKELFIVSGTEVEGGRKRSNLIIYLNSHAVIIELKYNGDCKKITKDIESRCKIPPTCRDVTYAVVNVDASRTVSVKVKYIRQIWKSFGFN
jgi:hypothetical protein